MNPLLLSPLFELGNNIISRLFPDPAQKAAAEFELLKLTQDGDLQKILAQLAINAKEAESASVFVSGWRPYVGWICGTGLLYSTIIHNLLEWLSAARGWPLPPAVDTDTLLYVLGALLGIGTLRTIDKIKGVATK
jgi:hypothetical protein